MKMKCMVKYAMAIIGVLVAWPLFLGYINWDIAAVTHIREWSVGNRGTYALMVVASIIAAIGGVSHYHCNDKECEI